MSQNEFPQRSLLEAQAAVLAGREDGIICECCDQFAKLYKRKLNTTMARGLIWLHNNSEANEYIHINALAPRFIVGTREYATTRHWGLVEEQASDDEKKRTSGYWRLTEQGRLFVNWQVAVPSHVHLYNNEIVGCSDKYISINEALGSKFDYQELMAA